MKKTLLSVIVLGMTFSGAVGVYAGTKMEKINAFLNHGITFNVNGADGSITDSSGKKLAPITYQNTTYLPVRAISNLAGINVEFDAASQQIRMETEQKSTNPVDNKLTTVQYSKEQIKAIKERYAGFKSFETAYAPQKMVPNDSYVKVGDGDDGVGLIFKHMKVYVSPRDYTYELEFKKVKLSNGVSAKWFTKEEMLGFDLDDRYVTISSADGSLSQSQMEQVAVSVAKLK
ncbi:stalk domain-containing protein [Paenibacillus herberti]|uniref:Copper amine oxidase-like N-terminal domain-containing protein n=1 Tax=Paenibacillus herberti TaxID=1619309 RepID=A0A229P375_9BACL|nr:stalk domain-containing protein [Paenibacillus herberti]OXM16501.1 hypothetical protein CGZ75_07455 [Paenibacillus herberti]